MLLKHRAASRSLQRYNRRIAIKRLIPMSTICYWYCYTPGDAAYSGLCPHWTTSLITTMSLSVPYHSWADGVPQKPHPLLAQSPDTPKIVLCFMLPWECEPTFAFELSLGTSWYRTNSHTNILNVSANIFMVELAKLIAMILFQINDLVMFGYVYPSHFRLGL